MKSIKSIITLVCVLFVLPLSAQRISEDDLSFDFLKWHYAKYPGAEENVWTKIKKDGAELMYVEFAFEGTKRSVTYTLAGQRLKERIKYDGAKIPNSAKTFLSGKFQGEKYKVDEFQKLVLFEGTKAVDSFYSMEIKVKKDLYVLYFDDNLSPIKSPTPQLLSSL